MILRLCSLIHTELCLSYISCERTPPPIHFKASSLVEPKKKEARGKQEFLQAGDTVSVNLTVLLLNFKSLNWDFCSIVLRPIRICVQLQHMLHESRTWTVIMWCCFWTFDISDNDHIHKTQTAVSHNKNQQSDISENDLKALFCAHT